MAKMRLMAILLVLTLAFTGCAGRAPVPGGDDDTNSKFYESPGDLINRINQLHPGMTHGQVFHILDRHAAELTKLSRAEINGALYGSQNAQFDGSLAEQEAARHFLQSLYGYRLDYAKVQRKHGFSSPIRVRTNKEGYRYQVLLIFQHGRLYDQPILSGGVVTDSSSR
ncbi:MAG: hypothetical protein KJ667_01630, partial [Alphaproteobacteria bacterium]|nr:hypothetical protein [Alphaproteobacteria bacterium]